MKRTQNWEIPSGKNESNNVWLTPPELIWRLGPFDLDPCAAVGQPWRTAKIEYTELDDGLSKGWKGFVWLNPPYGKQTPEWLRRMAEHRNGIALLFNRMDTNYFFDYGFSADCLFLLQRRLSFHSIDGKLSAGKPLGNILLGWGTRACNQIYNCGLGGCYIFGKEVLKGGRIN